MKNISKKVVSLLLVTLLLMGLVSCGKEAVMVTVEMPYATSSEGLLETNLAQLESAYNFDMEFTAKDNTVSMTLDEAQVPKVLEKIETEKDHFLKEYVDMGYVNSIEINNGYKDLIIDYTSTATQANVDEVYTEFLGLAMLYQSFTNVLADDFILNVTLKVDGEVMLEMPIDKAMMAQS